MKAVPAVFPLLCPAQACRTTPHPRGAQARTFLSKAGCRADTTDSPWGTVLMLSPTPKRGQRRLADRCLGARAPTRKVTEEAAGKAISGNTWHGMGVSAF